MAEVACAYAALILHDEGIAVDGEKIAKLLDAAKVEVEPFWPTLFANCLKKQNIGDLLIKGGNASAAPAAAAGAAAPAAGGAAPAKGEEKKEEKKKSSSSAGGADLGGGLFGGDDGW